MSFSYWKEIPEIGLKVDFICTYSGCSTIGCYSSMISGISVGPRPHYMGGNTSDGDANKYKWLRSLDPENPLVYQKSTDKYSEYYNYEITPPRDATLKYHRFVEGIKDVAEWLGEDFFKGLAGHITEQNAAAIYIMGDVINTRTPARNGGRPASENQGLHLKVCDFAKYLIAHKIGYTLESPIVQNPNHRVYGAYSLNQVWLWIPESQLSRSVNIASQHGEDKFPSKEKWLETVSEDFHKRHTMYSPAPKRGTRVEAEVFPGGKFPEGVKFSHEEVFAA